MILNRILDQFTPFSDRIFDIVNGYAHTIFFTLVFFELLFFGLRVSVRWIAPERVFTALVWEVFSLGMFLTILENSRDWSQDVINSFVMIGQKASGIQTLDPSSIVDQAIAVTGKMFASMGFSGTFSHPTTAGSIGIAAFIAFVAMVLVAGHVLYILVRTQIVISFSPLLLAFSGCRWTRGITSKYLSALLATGMTITALYCMIALADLLTQTWATELTERTGEDMAVYFEVIIGAVMYAVLVWLTPGYVADMFAGSVSVSLTEIERLAETFIPHHLPSSGSVTSPVTSSAPGSSGGALPSPVSAATSMATGGMPNPASAAASQAALATFRTAGSAPSSNGSSPQTSNPKFQQTLQKFANLGKKQP